MKFLTPAFVRVESSQERKELIEWLVGIGYTALFSARYNIAPIVACYASHVRTGQAPLENCGHYCGTNIPLFKALAAMNDENDLEQLFVCERSPTIRYVAGQMIKSSDHKFQRIDEVGTAWSKATSGEIIEHFKN